MPTYEYRCLNCNLRFELKQSFKDEPVAVCPACHSNAHRLFSPVPILFKGPGFYVTDSRMEKEGNKHTTKTAKEEKEQGDKT